MKYIITDRGEVATGEGYHHDLADGLKGRVIRAGYYQVNVNGSVTVWGRSAGYNIDAKPEDAQILKDHFDGKTFNDTYRDYDAAGFDEEDQPISA